LFSMVIVPRVGSMRPCRRPMLSSTFVGTACMVLVQFAHVSDFAFVPGKITRKHFPATIRRGLLDNLDTTLKGMKNIMDNPEKVKKLQEQMDAVMKDPVQRKALEEYQTQMQSAVENLKDDPEMKGFFDDVKQNGLDAIKKYQTDDRILRKFSEATGGPAGVPNMQGMPPAAAPAAPAAPAVPSFKPGDEVIIGGLAKAPELNGKKALVMPPTAVEKQALEGTNRLVVRVIDSGEQFAVKPENLKTTAQTTSDLMGKSLEDVSIYDPALQTEAAKLRESGKLDDLRQDPELAPVFADIKENGMGALEKYWHDEKLMAKISKAMAA